MNAIQIKRAVDKGLTVHWKNNAYTVIKDSIGQYLIKCALNNSCIGLTWQDGITLNGKETDFYLN